MTKWFRERWGVADAVSENEVVSLATVERQFSGGSGQSFLELARVLVDKPMVTSQHPGDAEAVFDMLSAAVTRQHALRAIGELNLDFRSLANLGDMGVRA